MKYDVFISHASEDKAAAAAVCHALEARAIRCWIAPRDIRPGANWGEAILEGISGARVMVLLLSGHANTSPHILREIERAVHRSVTIIPARIENILPAKSLEYFLSVTHWLDTFPLPIQPHLPRLIETVERNVGVRTSPPAPNRPAPSNGPALARPEVSPASPAAKSDNENWPILNILVIVAFWVSLFWFFPLSCSPPPRSLVSHEFRRIDPLVPSDASLAEPETPKANDFVGRWEIGEATLPSVAGGSGMTYRPVQFLVADNGQITGEAEIVRRYQNNTTLPVERVEIHALTGRLSSPRNKKYLPTVSATAWQSFYYQAADVTLKFDDGTEGKGTIAYTKGLPPLLESIVLKNGNTIATVAAFRYDF